jgi:hypothetical protein
MKTNLYLAVSLILFTAFYVQGDFMSIEMTDGHIMFRFGFGNEDETNVTTLNTYNTNRWVKVKARRNKTIGN